MIRERLETLDRIVEVRTTTGEVFHLGQDLPVAGKVIKIIERDIDTGFFCIYAISGAIDTFIDVTATTITWVEEDFVSEWLDKRQLAVNEHHRLEKSFGAVGSIAGKPNVKMKNYNPR